jgi:hypothetical protein
MSPAFLVPDGGGFLIVVNSKIVFHLYPMPMTQQALRKFLSAVVFSVLDLISAYYQIPLSVQICQVTAFCKPLRPFEFNKLPLGISVGCQGLRRVIDELFPNLKGVFFFKMTWWYICLLLRTM